MRILRIPAAFVDALAAPAALSAAAPVASRLRPRFPGLFFELLLSQLHLVLLPLLMVPLLLCFFLERVLLELAKHASSSASSSSDVSSAKRSTLAALVGRGIASVAGAEDVVPAGRVEEIDDCPFKRIAKM